jgi:hypothetical protein
MATTAVKDIVLEGPEHYHIWFANIQGSVPEDLWKYFDPEATDEFNEPANITVATLRQGATSIEQLTAADRTLYTQLRTGYNIELTQYQRYLNEKAKLRTKLLTTIPEEKMVLLPAGESIREWISNITLATKPSDTHMKDVTKSKHRSMMTAKFVEWPSAGPEKWLLGWLKLMVDCKKWSPALYTDWVSDFNLVWGEVSGAARLCDRLTEAETSGNLNDWNIYKASSELQKAWDQRLIRSGMKIAGKSRTTRAVFTTDVRFDGIGAHEGPIEDAAQQSAHSRTGSKKRTATDNFQRRSKKRPYRRQNLICWGCSGQHGHFHCPLILGSSRRKIDITNENRQAFDRRMKDPTFAGKVKKIREADHITQELTENVEAC